MIIDIFLPVSLIFIMFSLGLGLTLDDFRTIISHPKAFVVGIVNQMLVLPLVAFSVVLAFGLSNEIAVGMMILACCPGGVTSNIITKLSNGDTALSISFTAVVSLVTVVTLPAVVGFSMDYFMGADAPPIDILTLGLTMFVITTVPVSIGLLVNTRFIHFSKSFAPLANQISTVLFIVIVLGALASEWNTFVKNLWLLGPAIIVLISSMLIIGFNTPKLFGIDRSKSITVAIESGIQNATVGIAIGNIILSQGKGISVLSLPSGVYGILMYIVCLPFIFLFFNRANH